MSSVPDFRLNWDFRSRQVRRVHSVTVFVSANLRTYALCVLTFLLGTLVDDEKKESNEKR